MMELHVNDRIVTGGKTKEMGTESHSLNFAAYWTARDIQNRKDTKSYFNVDDLHKLILKGKCYGRSHGKMILCYNFHLKIIRNAPVMPH